MWVLHKCFLALFIPCVLGDQYKYIFVHDKFAIEDLNNKAVDAHGELYSVDETMALNVSFALKIDLPDDSKLYAAAVRWTNNHYGPPLIQFSRSIKQAMDMTAFDLQKLFIERFRPSISWPLQKGVTYRSVGWTPDVTKFPPNLPPGKWKVQLTFTFGNKTKIAVAAWYMKIVYK